MTFDDHVENIFEIIHKSKSSTEAISLINEYCGNIKGILMSYPPPVYDYDAKFFIYRDPDMEDEIQRYDLSEYLNDSYFVHKKLKQLL